MRLFWMTVPTTFEDAVEACRPHLRSAAVFSALINLLYLAPTIYMMQVYDRVVPTGGTVTLLSLTIIVGLALATLAALDAIRMRLVSRASLRVNRLLSAHILDRLMAQSRSAPDGRATAQAMREFDGFRGALGGQPVLGMLDVPWTPIYLVAAFLIHPVLGFLVIAAGAILVTLAILNSRASRASAQQAEVAAARAYAFQDTILKQAEVIRALGMRRALVDRQTGERQVGQIARARAQDVGGRYQAAVKFFRMFLQSLALGAGAWLAIAGEISVGAIIAASVLLSRALQPIEQLVGAWPTLVQARSALNNIHKLFEDTDADVSRRTYLPDPKGRVEFDNVVVRGGSNAILLRNISFTLEPGEVLGVIGPSGAGKSTLARVASLGRAADLGEIRIDGARIEDWDPERLALHIGYVPQEPSLLPGTIAENISRFAAERGEPSALIDDKVVGAATMVGVHDMILRMPNGYDTRLDADFRLSVGQSQRIALARALYGGPSILVLDEPNSALDAEGEAALARTIQQARARGAAIMIIAHRLSILSSADRLLVLEDGAVAAIGPRAEIVEQLRGGAVSANASNQNEGVAS